MERLGSKVFYQYYFGMVVKYSNNHDTFLGRENKFRREITCMKCGKLLLVKSVKETSQTVTETFHFKNPGGRIKIKI